jgi:hypothetical protein
MPATIWGLAVSAASRMSSKSTRHCIMAVKWDKGSSPGGLAAPLWAGCPAALQLWLLLMLLLLLPLLLLVGDGGPVGCCLIPDTSHRMYECRSSSTWGASDSLLTGTLGFTAWRRSRTAHPAASLYGRCSNGRPP